MGCYDNLLSVFLELQWEGQLPILKTVVNLFWPCWWLIRQFVAFIWNLKGKGQLRVCALMRGRTSFSFSKYVQVQLGIEPKNVLRWHDHDMTHIGTHVRHMFWDTFQINPTFIFTFCLTYRQQLHMQMHHVAYIPVESNIYCVYSPHPTHIRHTMIWLDIFGMRPRRSQETWESCGNGWCGEVLGPRRVGSGCLAAARGGRNRNRNTGRTRRD